MVSDNAACALAEQPGRLTPPAPTDFACRACHHEELSRAPFSTRLGSQQDSARQNTRRKDNEKPTEKGDEEHEQDNDEGGKAERKPVAEAPVFAEDWWDKRLAIVTRSSLERNPEKKPRHEIPQIRERCPTSLRLRRLAKPGAPRTSPALGAGGRGPT